MEFSDNGFKMNTFMFESEDTVVDESVLASEPGATLISLDFPDPTDSYGFYLSMNILFMEAGDPSTVQQYPVEIRGSFTPGGGASSLAAIELPSDLTLSWVTTDLTKLVIQMQHDDASAEGDRRFHFGTDVTMTRIPTIAA